MKIGRKANAIEPQTDARRVRDNVLQEQLLKKSSNIKDEEDSEKIQLGLGRAIRQQLDPEAIGAERQARVAEIKRRVESGEYEQPSSDTLAQAVGEELALEVLTSGEN